MATLAAIVTMAARILSLLLSLLMAGPMSWPAFALTRSLTHLTTAGSPGPTSILVNGVAAARAWCGYDGHGNVRFGLNDEGVISDRYTYDAFGVVIEPSGSTPNSHLYCGERFDQDLGLYYLRARYLNPNSGRFWTMDGFEGTQTDPLSLHKYLYAHADPVNGVDSTGHNTDYISFNISTAIAGGLAGATYGAYSAQRTGRNIWAGAAIGFGAGFVGGGVFGAVPAAV